MEHPALEDSSPPQKVVAICASAGGLSALSQVLSALPANFPAAITVVQHVSPHYPSMMADILSRRTKLPVVQVRPGDYLRTGTVYIAPPDHHLLVNADGSLSLSHSELVHFVRPSADLLFESVAASFKQQAIAVVLTGMGSDGAMGVRAIEEMGGTVIVQDYKTAEFGGMPEAAINTGVVDLVLPLNEIAPALVKLVAVEVKG
ncbi:chemotaxis protein CheB [Scytonema millei]|nr:chemotaxis protein CheB [Scytonema millei]